MIITIDGRLPAMNDIISANRTNKFAGAKQKKFVQRGLVHQIKAQCSEKYDRIAISFKWYEPNKKRDFDNIASAAKFILDALVDCEIIQNDGWKQLEPKMCHEFYHDKDHPRVELHIEGVA